MTDTVITTEWIPAKRTTDALKVQGYSVKQLNHIRRCFIRRYLNQSVNNASSTYSNMVKKSGSGHDIKRPESTTLADIDEKRSHKASDSKERAEELIEANPNAMTQEQAKAHLKKQRDG